MTQYMIKNYQQQFLDQQIELVKACTKSWKHFNYPTKDQLKQNYSQDHFTPETRHYVFDGDTLVGFLSSAYTNKDEGIANLQFPFVRSGYDEVETILMKQAFDTFKKENVKQITVNLLTGWEDAKLTLLKYGFERPKIINQQLFTNTADFDYSDLESLKEFIEVDPVKHKDHLVEVFSTEMTQSKEEIGEIIDTWKEANHIIMNTISLVDEKIVSHSMVIKNQNDPKLAMMTHISIYDESYLSRRTLQMKFMFQKLKNLGYSTIQLFGIPEDQFATYDTRISEIRKTVQLTKDLTPLQTV